METKVAIVTGASSGIGRHTASSLLKKGCRVYDFSRRDIPNENVTHIKVDVTAEENVNEAINSVYEKEGKIDILAYSTDHENVLREYNAKSICDYAQVPLVLVMNKGAKSENIQTLATVSFLEEKVVSLSDMEGVQIVSFENQQDCIDAFHYLIRFWVRLSFILVHPWRPI